MSSFQSDTPCRRISFPSLRRSLAVASTGADAAHRAMVVLARGPARTEARAPQRLDLLSTIPL